jgi:hypothetical protein
MLLEVIRSAESRAADARIGPMTEAISATGVAMQFQSRDPVAAKSRKPSEKHNNRCEPASCEEDFRKDRVVSFLG